MTTDQIVVKAKIYDIWWIVSSYNTDKKNVTNVMQQLMLDDQNNSCIVMYNNYVSILNISEMIWLLLTEYILLQSTGNSEIQLSSLLLANWFYIFECVKVPRMLDNSITYDSNINIHLMVCNENSLTDYVFGKMCRYSYEKL